MSIEASESYLSSHLTSSVASSSIASAKPEPCKTRKKTIMTVTTRTEKMTARPQPDPTWHAPMLDFSFLCLTKVTDAFMEVPTAIRRLHMPTMRKGKYRTAAMCLSNNAIVSLADISQVVECYLDAPYLLAWLDISYNMFSHIPSELLQFPNMQILYMHGNSLNDITQVAQLKLLPKLRAVTMHGNPIVDEHGYRTVVVYLLPNVCRLDCSLVTRTDKVEASLAGKGLWKHYHAAARKKKIEEAAARKEAEYAKKMAAEAAAAAAAAAAEKFN